MTTAINGSSYFPTAPYVQPVTLQNVEQDKAQEQSFLPERPTLTPPELALNDYRFFQICEETRKLGNQVLDSLGMRVTMLKEKIKEISAENMSKLREAASNAANSDFWSTLKKIATSLLSAISIVFGVSVMTTGGSALIGGAMIASGVLSLANFALCEYNVWDWISEHIAQDNEDLQNKLKMILPAACGILAGGIGILGSVNAVASGAIDFTGKALLVVQTVIPIFEGVTTIGKGISDGQLLWSKADLLSIQGSLEIQREKSAFLIDAIKNSMGDFRAMKAISKRTLESISENKIQLARQA